MITYRQYLLENEEESTGHVAMENLKIDGFQIYIGDIYYLNKEGHLHRENSPAIIARYNFYYWFKNGSLHRENGPAVENKNGDYMVWWVDGVRHRLDGPAKIERDSKEWYINGKYLTRRYATFHDKWLLLKTNIESNLEILNRIDMTRDMQEYVCQKRPDLIDRIENLDPKLRIKYEHELDLSRIDV